VTLRVKGRGMWPFHYVLIEGKEVPTRYVSRNELEASVPAGMIANAGTYRVTVKSKGEPVPESHPAHLVVGFK
jgi:hypothetical protein